MTCSPDAAGNYVCSSQDPVSATWHDLTAWTAASPLHLIFFVVACTVVGLFFQHRRNQARGTIQARTAAAAPGPVPEEKYAPKTHGWSAPVPSRPEPTPPKGPYR